MQLVHSVCVHIVSLLIFTGEYEKQGKAYFTSIYVLAVFFSNQIFLHAAYNINSTASGY